MNYGGAAAAATPNYYYPSNRRSDGGGCGLHEHPLVQLSLPNLFTCMACKEFGAGRRFSCQICNFEVHDFCATAHQQQQLNLHPLHPQHQLRLLQLPAAGRGKSTATSACDVCGMPIKGYSYRCSAMNCSFHLHPTCSMLSTKMEFPAHPGHPLILLPSMSTGSCGECRRSSGSSSSKKQMMMYSCTVADCDYHLHAACAKTMVNGLHAHGIKLAAADHPKKHSNNMLGAAAKIASHVVIGFIGGLVEGIGEGVGEALSQNIINVNKGNSSSLRRRTSTPRPPKYYNPPPPYHQSNA